MDQEQEQQQTPPPPPPHPHTHPHFTTALPPRSSLFPHKTSHSTPVSTPGLFSPTNPRPALAFPLHSSSDVSTPVANDGPYLHPLQNFKTRETHKAIKELDSMTGRKIINQYEVIEEIGRGMHGKVKLARNLEHGENVAIKIIPRFSKRRRLGKVTASPQDKTKREIAILKKMRHPNVVALLEVIDDPELKKIYMVLEHVELGEIVWRKKGIPSICQFERLRVEKEMRGEILSEEEEAYWTMLQRRHNLKEDKMTRMRQTHSTPKDSWSVETGGAADDDSNIGSFPGSAPDYLRMEVLNTVSRIGSRTTSRAPSRTQSVNSLNRPGSSLPSDADISSMCAEDDLETPLALHSNPGSSAALDGIMYGAYADIPEDAAFRGRSPSMADSIISHMSSVDVGNQTEDPLVDDYNYVPCFTIEEARSTFRDTVLGLEYLHYEGVVHRDIKPANLLWTRDHRVKISDFGVSYFGRPIREGDQEEGVSESEARDFDDDLELAKTVGTPAFFAPELCYTDLDQPPPKISEQIDVWSLGVTLYCLVFARIPFIAEDEYQMFRKIATEEVYIPHRRLQPVDPQTSPSAASLFRRVNKAPYRNDGELAYEDVDDLLHDLLRRMLEKNPEKRIRLREVKRHPWVVFGIPHLIDWIDDTDPSRTTSGRKIQVDDREITRAVIPLTFLERARSAVKKAVGKVIHHRTDRESTSRRRAVSSATSSAGDSPGSSTPHVRDLRRRSIRPDDYFATLTQDHPLAQSVTASPQGSPMYSGSLSSSHGQTSFLDYDYNSSVGGSNSSLYQLSHFAQPGFASTSAPSPPFTRHAHSRSTNSAFLALTPSLPGIHTTPCTPGLEDATQDPSLALRKGRDIAPGDDSSRSRSVDRGLFTSNDKRSEARVSVSTVIAPGSLESPMRHFYEQPADSGDSNDVALPSPMFFFPKAIRTYQDASVHAEPQHVSTIGFDGRPSTARINRDIPEGKTPPPRMNNSSTPESFGRAQQQMLRRQQREDEEQALRQQLVESRKEVSPSAIPCPPSPDDEVFPDFQGVPAHGQTEGSTPSPVGAFATSPTSFSEVASPTSTANLTSKTDGSQIFRSDPSLPALLSGASSVSADPEGDFLGEPGVIPRPSLLDTNDTTGSLTPPALKNGPEAGFPLEQSLGSDFSLPVPFDQKSSRLGSPAVLSTGTADDDEDDSDSDEGLVMAKPKKKLPLRDAQTKVVFKARRRDTQTSVGSTETAKKVVVGNES